MSEYQYYEFRAIDRPLTQQQMAALRSLSSRAEIDSRSFVNVYNYGDFRGSPEELMQEYFDAHLYVANWGTNKLAFRLPRELVDLAAFEPYFDDEFNVLTVTDDFVVVRFRSDLEGGEGWIDGEGMIEDLLPVREELLAGDLRALYLAWLSAVTAEYRDEQDEETLLEPPVPPGLQSLTAAQKAFAAFMRVDDDLLVAAAEQSTKSAAGSVPGPEELAAWLAREPAARKEGWLLELLTEEGLGPRREILRGLQKAHTAPAAPAAGKRRTLAELLRRAKQQEEVRKAAAAAARAAATARKAAVRARYLDGLAGQEKKLWDQAEAAIETKKPAGYDQAITLMKDLRDLAERQGKGADVRKRIEALRARHTAKTAFVRRLRDAGLVE
jgi:hypothetical protein